MIKWLNLRLVFSFLFFFESGEIPLENSLLRQVSSLLRRLPVTESGKFQDDFLMVSALACLISLAAVFPALTNLLICTKNLAIKLILWLVILTSLMSFLSGI